MFVFVYGNVNVVKKKKNVFRISDMNKIISEDIY